MAFLISRGMIRRIRDSGGYESRLPQGADESMILSMAAPSRNGQGCLRVLGRFFSMTYLGDLVICAPCLAI